MPEGLSPSEVGKEIAEHRHQAGEQEKGRGAGAAEVKGRERWLTITEALLLAVVAVLAARSGFASAARIGLISVAGVILVFSSISLIVAPKPPV